MAFSIAVCSGRDLFAVTGITMFRYLGVLFHIVYYCWGIKKMGRHAEDVVTKRFVISRFHCILFHGLM